MITMTRTNTKEKELTMTRNGMIINRGKLIRFIGKESLLVIPEGVTEICSWAFGLESQVTKVVMPSTLKVINKCAFYKANVYQIELNEGLELIHDEAFSCSTIMFMRIPSSVTRLGKSCFAGCYNLRSVVIEEKGFAKRPYLLFNEYIFSESAIEEISVPNDVKIFGNGIFSNCSNLAKVEIEPGVTIKEIVFEGTTEEDVDFKNKIIFR